MSIKMSLNHKVLIATENKIRSIKTEIDEVLQDECFSMLDMDILIDEYRHYSELLEMLKDSEESDFLNMDGN